MDDNSVKMPLGIDGLDEMMEGGRPIPSTIHVAGRTGTCKTISCPQFRTGDAERGQMELFF